MPFQQSSHSNQLKKILKLTNKDKIRTFKIKTTDRASTANKQYQETTTKDTDFKEKTGANKINENMKEKRKRR